MYAYSCSVSVLSVVSTFASDRPCTPAGTSTPTRSRIVGMISISCMIPSTTFPCLIREGQWKISGTLALCG